MGKSKKEIAYTEACIAAYAQAEKEGLSGIEKQRRVTKLVAPQMAAWQLEMDAQRPDEHPSQGCGFEYSFAGA